VKKSEGEDVIGLMTAWWRWSGNLKVDMEEEWWKKNPGRIQR